MLVRWCLVVVLLTLAVAVSGCGGNSSNIGDSGQTAFNVPHKPGPGDAIKDPSVVTYTGEYEDLVPDTWSWDMIYGQFYFQGTAEITFDGTNYFMHYELFPEAVADGWAICETHADIELDPADFPKNGNPGQFDWNWTWDETYPDSPPTSFDLELTGWTPPADGLFYVAVHATVCKGTWQQDPETLEWEWVVESSNTGWGGVWDAKSEDFESHWYGTWPKKWGGYAYTGDLSRYPIWDDFYKQYYVQGVPGTSSYWNAYFVDNSPASFFFEPDYWQDNPWQAWCSDPRYLNGNVAVDVDLYSCYDPNLPNYAKSGNWDLISFMVNQRRNPTPGGPFDGVSWTGGNILAFQDAVWYFKYGPEDPWWATADDNYWFVTITEGSLADSFIDYAIANGEGYFPRPGEWYAVICFPVVNPLTGNWGYQGQREHTPAGFQTNIIEVDP